MSDYHSVYDGNAPDWIEDDQIVFVQDGGFGWSSEDYGPIPAKLVNWAAVSAFRLATAETTYR